MCIKPQPFTYICTSCGWSKRIAPKSDCLMPGDYYDKCPICDSKKLETKQLTRQILNIKEMFSRLFK